MTPAEEREQLRQLLNAAKEESEKSGTLVVVDDTQMELPAPRYDARTYTLRCIKLNRDEEDIVNSLKYIYGFDREEAKKLFKNCKSYLAKQYKEYRDNVAEKNILMLQQIAEDALLDGQRKTAIEAIRELNRMCGLGVGNNFYQQNNFNFDDVQIVFK